MLTHVSLFATTVGRVDAYSVAFATLRHWNLRADKCFIAHLTWETLTITNCRSMRCTFCNTSFCNIQFLNCTFVDVDFEKVAMRNSLNADTALSDCSIIGSIFDSVS